MTANEVVQAENILKMHGHKPVIMPNECGWVLIMYENIKITDRYELSQFLSSCECDHCLTVQELYR